MLFASGTGALGRREEMFHMTDGSLCLAAPTPRILWVELTSKCPFDCVFCSRQLRRGAGMHLPFEVYSALLRDLKDPRKFVLNYSGESTVYPELIPAIEAARATGAFVELVSVLATAPESLLGPLSRSGLSRLTVSVHATSPSKFTEIYRHGSFEILRARLAGFVEQCRTLPHSPTIDLAFVAMDTNLAELPSVAVLAATLGLRDIMIFPVMRRDSIPALFARELENDGTRRPEFEKRLHAAVEQAEHGQPGVRFTVCNASCEGEDRRLGEVPVPYPWELPEGAWIHSCEQNPWETAHVLSNGDVVACEVLDRHPLGNLVRQPIEEIWHGASYRQFRERYRRGEVAECRTCPWKRAYRPRPPASEIIAARGLNAQLLYGWHEPAGEEHIWSSQHAAAVLMPRSGSRTLHVSGMLPPGSNGSPNHLEIRLNGTEIGRVTNPWEETVPFGLDFSACESRQELWNLEFRTAEAHRPSELGASADQRDLGFALVLAASKEFVDREREVERKSALDALYSFVRAVDCWGRKLRNLRRRTSDARRVRPWRPGISIVIPEWDNAAELAACLDGVHKAGLEWDEPLELIAVVNGSPRDRYGALQSAYPEVRWRFHDEPLGFGGAIRAGLQCAHHDWVYLLNSDVVLDGDALRAAGAMRSAGAFSIASQIFLKDATRFREETNWSSLKVESGLAALHDLIPRSDKPVPTFYGGGGASLFRTALLRRLMTASAYDPFYWEDVEWGWRARKLGYESWFCPASIARHTQRSTIGRHYAADTVEQIVRRHALLFQLRNFTTAGTPGRAIEEIARAPEPVSRYFLSKSTWLRIARGRLWNYLAPFTDEEVFDRWNISISNC